MVNAQLGGLSFGHSRLFRLESAEQAGPSESGQDQNLRINPEFLDIYDISEWWGQRFQVHFVVFTLSGFR